jgi:CDP-glycerol glycerophosphotransferase (TagB/SpsB family)
MERLVKDGYHIMLADTRDTHDVLSNIDAIISPMSTILVEAMIHGKLPLCYLPLDDVEARHFQSVYQLTHFRELQSSEGILLAKGRGELVGTVQELMSKSSDPAMKERVREFGKFFVAQFDESYAKRITTLVENFQPRPR